jgi:hypothetical protein
MPQAGAAQSDASLSRLDLAVYLRTVDEQLRPAFSNLIVGYCSIEGSKSARKLPKRGFYWVADI